MDFKIRSLWKPQGDMQCIDLGSDFFLIRFKLGEDYWKVVNNGPWFINQQFLTVCRWSSGFRPSEAKISTTAVWARLPELPIELYDMDILRCIDNQIGTLLKIDARTRDNVRGRFARLCVQIDIDQPLVPKIRVGDIVQRIQYEGVSAICFKCGCVGHRADSCPSSLSTSVPPTPPTPPPPPTNSPLGEDGEIYGKWMLVTRRKSLLKKSTPSDTAMPNRLAQRHPRPSTTGKLPQEGQTIAQHPKQAKALSISTANVLLHASCDSDVPPLPQKTSSGPHAKPNTLLSKTSLVESKVAADITSNQNPRPTQTAQFSPNGERTDNLPLLPETQPRIDPHLHDTPETEPKPLTLCNVTSRKTHYPTTLDMELDPSTTSAPHTLNSTPILLATPSYHPTHNESQQNLKTCHQLELPTTVPSLIRRQLGSSQKGKDETDRGQPCPIVTGLSHLLLDPSGRGHRENSTGPSSTHVGEHPNRTSSSKLDIRTSYCLTNAHADVGYHTPLERPQGEGTRDPSLAKDSQWDGDAIRVDHCRSPRSYDHSNIPRQHSDSLSLPCNGRDHHHYRSAPTDSVISSLDRLPSLGTSPEAVLPLCYEPPSPHHTELQPGISSSSFNKEAQTHSSVPTDTKQ